MEHHPPLLGVDERNHRWKGGIVSAILGRMARPVGIEPATHSLEGHLRIFTIVVHCGVSYPVLSEQSRCYEKLPNVLLRALACCVMPLFTFNPDIIRRRIG